MRLPTCLLLLLAPALSQADFEIQYSDGTIGLVRNGAVLLGDSTNSVLFRPGEDGMIVIDREQRTWMRLAPGFAAEAQARMKAQLDEMLADMPPEQRAMIEAQMGDLMPGADTEMPRMTVARTGQTDVVAGFDCDVAQIMFGADAEEIVCIAGADELGVSGADFSALTNAMQSMAELASINPGGPPAADFSQLRGIPVRTRALSDSSESELVSIDTSAIDASRFEVPAGFAEITLDDIMR